MDGSRTTDWVIGGENIWKGETCPSWYRKHVLRLQFTSTQYANERAREASKPSFWFHFKEFVDFLLPPTSSKNFSTWLFEFPLIRREGGCVFHVDTVAPHLIKYWSLSEKIEIKVIHVGRRKGLTQQCPIVLWRMNGRGHKTCVRLFLWKVIKKSSKHRCVGQ